MEQEIELEVEQMKSPNDVLKVFHRKHIREHRNLVLRCMYKKDITDIQQFAILVFIIAAFAGLTNELGEDEMDVRVLNLLGQATSKDFSKHVLEAAIEKEWQTRIEWDRVSKQKAENPLDGIFGLWKDRDISLQQIRQKTWLRQS